MDVCYMFQTATANAEHFTQLGDVSSATKYALHA